jgi:hypothetical protein
LNACSSGPLRDVSSAKSEGSVVGLVSVPAMTTEPVTLNLEVLVRRAGFEGRVHLELQDLPAGATGASLTLEENRDVARFVVAGLSKPLTKASVRVRFGSLEFVRSVRFSEAKSVLDLPGGTHSQTVRALNSNVNSSVFVTHQVYANFEGSSCQVMVRASNAGLYVCFNEAIRAGQTYALIAARDAIPGTASITYFQGPAASSRGQALWDSVSGRIEVLSVSRSKIEFRIRAATFSPARGFGTNLAVGEFVLEAATTVTDISHLPEEGRVQSSSR